jgi:hypothetical protein
MGPGAAPGREALVDPGASNLTLAIIAVLEVRRLLGRLVVRAWTCAHARSCPIGSAASKLSRVLTATVHLVLLRADLEPTRRNGRFGALGGLAMLVIDEAETPTTVNGDSTCVVHVLEGSAAL